MMDKHLPPMEEIIFAVCNGVVAGLLLFLVVLPQHLALYTVISVVGIAILHPLAQLFGVPIPAGSIAAAMQRRRAARNPLAPDVQRQPLPTQRFTAIHAAEAWRDAQPLPNPPTKEVAPPLQRDPPNMYVDPNSPYMARDDTTKSGWNQPPQR